MVKFLSSNHVWRHRDGGRYLLIGTTGAQRRDGTAVLADGVAREAECRHTQLEWLYGQWLSSRRSPNPFGDPGLYVNDDLRIICTPICDGGTVNPAVLTAALRAAAGVAAERGVDLVAANAVCGCGRTRIEDVDAEDIFSTVDLIVCSGH